MKIPFNKPHFTGNEINFMTEAAREGRISGNGNFTRQCHSFFEKKYGFGKAFLTNSCTDALEMAAVLTRFEPGDEVICPSFTFVSTASAFALHNAKIVFADSRPDQPNIDETLIESLISHRTKAIIVVHYSGVACNMDAIMHVARKYNLLVVEDAALSIDSWYRERALGSIGHLASFSFHETKNIITGEGGMLTVNDGKLKERAEIIWEKGTNRAAFQRGDVVKYEWVDVGASYLPSEMMAAALLAQLKDMKIIQQRRKDIWYTYFDYLKPLQDKGLLTLPVIPGYANVNGSMFYFLARNPKERIELLQFLNKKGVHAVFHYLPLHNSPYYKDKHDGRELPNAVRYAETIVRLPFFYGLSENEIAFVAEKVSDFFRS
ncbi:MAG: dTDP-4-amino-4,6-dideoxygalactose transaminase [Bacteroidetes bacterium]|nr:dTDP-4-amino-4,6-dideoxygalactose transaminase [Bacteroidota bacterium]